METLAGNLVRILSDSIAANSSLVKQMNFYNRFDAANFNFVKKLKNAYFETFGKIGIKNCAAIDKFRCF